MPFTLSFDTENIAHNNGKIWEIDIPGIKTPSDFKTFAVEVRPPSSFGKPSLVKPLQNSKSLTFDKDQLGKSGISIAFGDKQVYDFNLKYHLKNSNLFPLKTEIALPPDTNYQKVFIENINPKPSNVIIDNDGNWLAQYSLTPSQKLDISVKGNVEISLNPKSSPISDRELAEYTAPTRYWQSNDPQILKLAKKLKTADAIYEFVAKTLKYDFSRVTQNKGRLGGINVLSNPTSAACREFTDLFIALSRAAGIPAREVNGFAYTENSRERPVSLVQDILHAWPEYYDTQKKSWVMVDPTWGSTTGGVDYFDVLDFDHFTFAIKGKADNYPIPAGGYKDSSASTMKDVDILFSDKSSETSQSVDIQTSFSKPQIAGLPISVNARLANSKGSATIPQLMYVSSDNLSPKNRGFKTPAIPPFGFVENKINFDRTSFLTNKDVSFAIRYAGKNIEQKTKIIPFFLLLGDKK